MKLLLLICMYFWYKVCSLNQTLLKKWYCEMLHFSIHFHQELPISDLSLFKQVRAQCLVQEYNHNM